MNGGPLFSGILDNAVTPIGHIQLGVAPAVMQLSATIAPAGSPHIWQSGKTFNASIAPAATISKSSVLGRTNFNAGLSLTGAIAKGMVLGRNTFNASISPSGAIIEQPFHTYVGMLLLAFVRKWKFVTSSRMFNTTTGPRVLTLTVLDSGRASLSTNPITLEVATSEYLSLLYDLTAGLVAGEAVILTPIPALSVVDTSNGATVYSTTFAGGGPYGVGVYGARLYGANTLTGTQVRMNLDGSKLMAGRTYKLTLTTSTSQSKTITVVTNLRTVI